MLPVLLWNPGLPGLRNARRLSQILPRMLPSEFHDAALLLVAHGSTLNPDSALPTYLHADELRRRGIFAEVTEAFWKQEPGFAAVWRGIFAPRVFVVPMFISDGWFTEHVIPTELGLRRPAAPDFPRVQDRNGQRIYYCRPVGSHASMTEVLRARAAAVVAQHPFPRPPRPEETALFIAGHGTSYSKGSRQAIDDQVTRLRARNEYAEVHAVFLEEEPLISACWEMAKAKAVVLVPFFISDGLHCRQDIPVMLGEPEATVLGRLRAGQPTWRNPTERHGKRLWCAPAVGTEPGLSEVILERVRQAARDQSQGSLP